MKKYHYTYYSYEEFGKGYIGSRSSKSPPEEDTKYFGSFSDKTFKPTHKIILKTYKTREEALADEIKLHEFYDVANNSRFANKAKQTSTKFIILGEAASEAARKSNLNRSLEQRREAARKASASLTPEQRSEAAKKANASLTPEQRSERTRKANLSRTPEQRSEAARKRQLRKTPEQRSQSAKKANASLTPEQRSERARKASASRTPEQRSESAKKGKSTMTSEQRSEAARKANASLTQEQRSEKARRAGSQKFQCTETGYISNSGGLSAYQKARGIDTSKRIRVDAS